MRSITESVSIQGHTPTRREIAEHALRQADVGRHVFPVRDKEPRTRRGFYDASSNRARVTAMFNAAPDATGYAIRTGAASRLVVVDVDGPQARAEAERRGLRSGYVVKTGRPEGDGFHVYLSVPDGAELRSCTIAPGLELKAESTYVVGPGSLHPSGKRYTVLKDGEPSPAPEWVLEAGTSAAEPKRNGNSSADHPVSIDVAGPPIPEGTRDVTISRILGRLHDGTRALDQLTADALAINEARCQPPLLERQVEKIARSIYRRPPCKPARETTPEVLEVLDRIEEVLWRREWPGIGGKTDRDLCVALLKLARRHGQAVADGVEVSVSLRALALLAAVSKRSVGKGLTRLMEAGMIRRGSQGAGKKAGSLVLLTPRAKVAHSNHRGVSVEVNGTDTVSGLPLRAPFTAPRLRWSAPVFDHISKTVRIGGAFRTRTEIIRSTIRRLGKGCGAVIDALERAGGSTTLEELADALHQKRSRDLRRRTLARLEAAAVVECDGNIVALAADWIEALNRERVLTGEIAAMRRDTDRYNRERAAYRKRHRIRPDRAPSEADMAVGRETRHQRLRVEQLVAQGMARRFAEEAVYGDHRERYAERRRRHIAAAIARLFAEKPEYRSRRVGQITCALGMRYIGEDFPLGSDGYPKDAEVEELLDGAGVAA